MKKTVDKPEPVGQSARPKEIRSARELLQMLAERPHELTEFVKLFERRVDASIKSRIPNLEAELERHLLGTFRTATGKDLKAVRTAQQLHGGARDDASEAQFVIHSARRSPSKFALDYLYLATTLNLVSTARGAIFDICNGPVDIKTNHQVKEIIDFLAKLVKEIAKQPQFRDQGTTNSVPGMFDLHSTASSIDYASMMLSVSLEETRRTIMERIDDEQKRLLDLTLNPPQDDKKVKELNVHERKSLQDWLDMLVKLCQSLIAKLSQNSKKLEATTKNAVVEQEPTAPIYTLTTPLAHWTGDYLTVLIQSLNTIINSLESRPGLFMIEHMQNFAALTHRDGATFAQPLQHAESNIIKK
ncbi:hypothetical protein KBB08_00120 [Candidatus Gracilibacteria bacterium]|jgi:hypothetical protein|nr:hypothetical protein [Candidatus Gracilibacteria bacterium]